ncbi:efflux RND transporter periplasmic adaptor subunit [Trichloromonas sp.]|uniref:efflux RND transporter periplasmic adaptor subunit n=1 Tax=Trichloromonas sp. TaxID=3069249 RepID=UPI003D8161F1
MKFLDTRRGSTHFGRNLFSLALLTALLFCGLLMPAPASAEPLAISGITEPYQDVALGIAVAGRVARIHTPEGAIVAKGDIILELDKRLEELETDRRQLIWKSKAEVESAARQLKTLETHLKSTRSLYDATGSVNREELENQELEYELTRGELARLESAEKREEIEYGIAKEQLGKRSLRAPFAGAIAELLVGIGENCELDKPLVQLVDTSRAYFVTNIELSTLAGLKKGQTVELQLQTGGDPVSKKAEIVFISPVVDPASGLRKVKALFDNQDGKVIPGVTGVMLLQ